MKTTPHEVVFGIKSSLEPEPTLKVVDEPGDSEDNTALSDRTELEQPLNKCSGI